MRLKMLAAAAAAMMMTGFAAAPADAQDASMQGTMQAGAQGGMQGSVRHRTVVRTTTTTTVHRNNGRHLGWRNRHRSSRVCRTVWHNHQRRRVCTTRYR